VPAGCDVAQMWRCGPVRAPTPSAFPVSRRPGTTTIGYFKPAARAALLPAALRVHDPRHTCASLLIREGASIKAVQHHLGHKSASITLDRYGHLFPEELDHLADRLERL